MYLIAYSILTGRDPEGTELVFMIDDNSILETALDRMGIDTSAIRESRLAEEREEIRKSGSQNLTRIRGGSRGFLYHSRPACHSVHMVYSHYVPNTGEGITDYKAYKESSVYDPGGGAL